MNSSKHVWVERERIDRLEAWITNLKIIGGKIARWGHGKNAGINIVIDQKSGSSSGSSVVPAKIVSKDGAFYLVDLYADGFDEAATETNVLAQILMLNYADTLPAGTKVLVASSYIDSTGGGTP